jgi:hypothetical protein
MLLPISGETIVDRIVDGPASYSISPFTRATGYRADDPFPHVSQHFPSGRTMWRGLGGVGT